MVLVEETVTYLEMTSADQLVPGRPPPAPLTMERLDPASLPLLRSTYDRIGAPHRWVGRSAWSDAQWSAWLSRPGMQPWIARVDGEVAGMVELELQSGGDVEIVVFGLVPEFVGRGFGSHLLTLGTRLAWEAEHPDKAPTRRVWLHTSSRDHPNARPNYERRGFRGFRTEHRRRDIPG
ncbi:MAG TPA: GNAT family N-acetyltransferase [Actinomycetota bacterium]|nr:GNAT family N-acetyltransferase [Actinomycetota bacterium]